MVISSKKVKSSDFENVEQYEKNKGFIQWVKSISKFISDDDVLLKKLQDDLLLPVTRQVESVRSELNKGRVNKYYQNQKSVIVDFLKSDVEDKEFNLIVEYLWEVADCVLDTYNNDFHSNIYDIKQKYRGLISKKTLKQFDAIVSEIENGVALGGFDDIFNPLDYLIRGAKVTSKIHPFDFYSYIIFDKNQNKFLLQHPGGTIFGQNLPSNFVLSNPIKPRHEGDSFDNDDSKEDGVFPDDDGFITIGEKEMLGYIDKFLTNLVQNKRTFKPGQLPVVTQNSLSIWKILFNDSDYVAKSVVNSYPKYSNSMLKTDEIIREELYSSMFLRTEQTGNLAFPDDFLGSKFIPFIDIFVTDVRFNGKRTGVYKKLIRNVKLTHPNKRKDYVISVVEEVLKKANLVEIDLDGRLEITDRKDERLK